MNILNKSCHTLETYGDKYKQHNDCQNKQKKNKNHEFSVSLLQTGGYLALTVHH
jgi:hypothetical protein